MFDYERDLKDLQDICAKVYGGADYIPRIIHRIAHDPGHMVLAVEATQEQHQGAGSGPSAQQATCVDGIICSERRGGALFLYGLRVREGSRGRGLGHLLMGAICASAPDVDAAPPALQCQASAFSPTSTSTAEPAEAHAACTTRQPPHPGQPAQPPSLPPTAASTAPGAAAPRPISHVVTCTTSYNPAAQRIIGRQLRGPLCEVEIWPGNAALGAYEEAAGWERGRGVPPGSPHMLDWITGTRQALEADAAAQALLPRWRRAASDAELRSAVAHLLYGDRCGEDGGGVGGSCSVAAGPCVTARGCLWPLLWLPMPYDVWPLDSPFVQRELAAGNIWLLRAPAAHGRSNGHIDGQAGAGGAGGDGCNGNDACRAVACAGGGEGSSTGGSGGNGGDEAEKEQEEEVVGVMLIAYFDTLKRVCAGILARDSAVAHAAIAHAGSLHPHFLASVLRDPSNAKPPRPSEAAPPGASGPETGGPDLPALYGATGGFRDFWVYGRPEQQARDEL